MCGIFGYVGPQDAIEVCLEGLRKMEYRGYDSAGIAGVRDKKLLHCKEIGKITELDQAVKKQELKLDHAIAHTRWATHGKPTKDNAHPHFDVAYRLAVVHNGIIENHDLLRRDLESKGIKFRSETDTEVVAQLIGSCYQGDFLKAVQEAVSHLKGAFALAIVHQDHPDEVIAVGQQSPLAIGVGNGETFIASDTHAFLVHTRQVIFLENGEIAVIRPEGIKMYDRAYTPIKKETQSLQHEDRTFSKAGFAHFMAKEIFEQPQSIRNALLSRFTENCDRVTFQGLKISDDELLAVKRIVILACGTSYHAGNVAAYMIEDLARIPVEVGISSEYRYKNPIVQDHTLVIAISQSGETADTLAAMREFKAKGAKVLGIVNVQGSAIAREADACLFLHAGTEVGVASTKAYTSQLVVLSLFGIHMARMRDMSKSTAQTFITALKQMPELIQKVLEQSDKIAAIVKKYADKKHFFFIGRRYMVPAAWEGALKLKEISYIDANGYAAGEIKHGPIALINQECPTVACCADRHTYDKMLSNLMEIKARHGNVIAIAYENAERLTGVADEIISIPHTLDELAAIPVGVVTQLIAYHIAHNIGREIDQPRNLAKSVTVE